MLYPRRHRRGDALVPRVDSQALPEELNGWFGLLVVPPGAALPGDLEGRRRAGSSGATRGRTSTPAEVLDPILPFRLPLLVSVGRDAASRSCRAPSTALYPAGLQWYWRADVFKEMSDEAIDVHLKFGPQLPTWPLTMHLYPIDGAAAHVADDATAFAYRDGRLGRRDHRSRPGPGSTPS